jgi:ferric-dicitrate binding protein FerR (iron transport regulator)
MAAPLADPSLRAYTLVTSAWVTARSRRRTPVGRPGRRARRADDRGEGVISAAIVVLIMAAIGALMWTAFRGMWEDIEADTNEKISEVGD